jgi:carboxymethylenebutenolidase
MSTTEAEIEIHTGEGTMSTFIVHPDGGPHPLVVFLMDAPGKRPLLHDMARRLAGNGYYIMLPNLYYRSTPRFELDFASEESFSQMVELMHNMGNKMASRDVGALIAYAESDPAADATRSGCVGYCMSGPFAIWAAADHADHIRAAASFYGVRLHVDAPDSPHRRLAEISGELYVACAEHDEYVPLEMIDRFEAAMQQAGSRGRVERYWGTQHGFAFNDRPAYDPIADERHWNALLDLFERNLSPVR